MGRKAYRENKDGLKKGRWAIEEDRKLINFIYNNPQCLWRDVPKFAGLSRCGKSCRLRWLNYLRPDLKREVLSPNEEKLIMDLYAQFGSKWSKIASHLPGRTDNEIKNQWHTHLKKKLMKMNNHHLTNPTPPSINIQEHDIADPKQQQSSTFSSIDQLFVDKQSTRPNHIYNEEREIHKILDIGSCINKVPLMEEKHKILIPSASSTSSSSPNITTKIDTTSYHSSKLGEELQLHDFEWPCDDHNKNISLWDDEFRECSYLCIRSPSSDVFGDSNGGDSKFVWDLDSWIHKYDFF